MEKRYRVNEIFYSLQGEGRWTGTPMVFLRFSGCNLRCPFCDTDFSAFEPMDAETIAARISEKATSGCKRVCITGGEPLLQLDSALIDTLHGAGFTLHVETNGTLPRPENLDWVTMSPKGSVHPGMDPDEIKIVYQAGMNEEEVDAWRRYGDKKYYCIQPCDTGDSVLNTENIRSATEFVLSHPAWRLSLQTHKITGIK